MPSTTEKIFSYLNLPNGWHYSQGVPPTKDIVAKAIGVHICYSILGFTKTNAFPGIDGEIMVTAYAGDHCIEITVQSDSFIYTHKIGKEDKFYAEDISEEQLMTYLAKSNLIIKVNNDG